MGEKPVFSTQAHVFQIDPETRKKWVPSAEKPVVVSYYYDPNKRTHRIIAIEGAKVHINSTITANMTFTKTSPKFGQWSDHRANTVFGLGFASAEELNEFSEKFSEAKLEAKKKLDDGKKISTKQQVLHRGPNGSTSPGAVTNHSPLSPPKSSPYPATGDEPDEQMDNGKEEEKVTSDEETKKLTFEIEQLKLALATSKTNAKRLEEEKTEVAKKYEQLQTDISQGSNDDKLLHDLKEENFMLKEKLEGLLDGESVKTLKAENKSLERQIDELQVELGQARLALAELKEKHQNVSLHIENAEEGRRKSELMAKGLEEKLDEERELLNEFKSGLTSKHKEIQDMLYKLSELHESFGEELTL